MTEAQQLREEAFAVENTVKEMRLRFDERRLRTHQRKMLADLEAAAQRLHAIASLSDRTDLVALNPEINSCVTKYMADTKAMSREAVVNECLRSYFGAM